jgi:hypothetical protein
VGKRLSGEEASPDDLQECDLLLDTGRAPAYHLGFVVKVWHERDLSAELADPIYAAGGAARERLNALWEENRIAREQPAAPPRASAEREALKWRTQQTDEGREWGRLADAVSGMQQGSPPRQE